MTEAELPVGQHWGRKFVLYAAFGTELQLKSDFGTRHVGFVAPQPGTRGLLYHPGEVSDE